MGKPAPKIKLDGDETDAFCGEPNVWSPGSRKKVKERYNRRLRRMAKRKLCEDMEEMVNSDSKE